MRVFYENSDGAVMNRVFELQCVRNVIVTGAVLKYKDDFETWNTMAFDSEEQAKEIHSLLKKKLNVKNSLFGAMRDCLKEEPFECKNNNDNETDIHLDKIIEGLGCDC